MNNFKVETEKTNLKSFIKKLKEGDGWYNVKIPKKIGKALETLFGTDAEEEYYCVIIRKKWTTGIGTNFHYWYQWDINVYGTEIVPWKLREAQESNDVADVFGTKYSTTLEESHTGYRVTVRY